MDSDNTDYGFEDEDEVLGIEDGDDELDLAEPGQISRQASRPTEDFHYECLTPEIIAKTMIESIEEVNDVFQIPSTVARQLLAHYNWDKERLLERYFSGDQDSLFADAHVINPHKKPKSKKIIYPAVECGTMNCEICMSAVMPKEMTGLECGHQFCCRCWQTYLTFKITEEGVGQSIMCPSHNCDIFVDELTVYRLLKDGAVIKKYQYLLALSFVKANRSIKFCPSPDCQNAIKVSYFESRPVRCECGHWFCFGCSDCAHEPVMCVYLKKWKKKCDDDSETSNWISANTKECPKCHITIEKNGGCNHMVCRNMGCKFEFCWVCQGPWEPHGSSWYNCNRYDEKDAQAARDSQAKSRAVLERYLHYCNRYMNHLQSSRFEKKLYASVLQKMEEMQQQGMSWIEVQFLHKAVDVLCMCRNTLMYTYVFAFYLKKTNQSVIFEDNQKDLEMATETLSGYLEREITTDSMADIKQQVQDKLRYCQHRRQVLLDHVFEGYEQDWWEYLE